MLLIFIVIGLCPISLCVINSMRPDVVGVRVESSLDNVIKVPSSSHIVTVDAKKGREFTVILFGNHLKNVSEVFFVTNADCEKNKNGPTLHGKITIREENAIGANVEFVADTSSYVACVKPEQDTQLRKNEERVQARKATDGLLLGYIYLQIPVCLLLLFCSGLFSGINLGMLSLNTLELQLLIQVGTRQEKKYAATILPVRRRANLLLCSIVIGNTLTNVLLTIIVSDLVEKTVDADYSFVVSLLVPTFMIVIFGEIIPQTLCHKRGLCIGARTIWVTKTVILLTCPLSFPLSLILDRIFGKEGGGVYDRVRLLKLIELQKKETSDKDEFRMVTGALDVYRKTVRNIYTPIEKVFMQSSSSVLDARGIVQIINSGFTRIPVYEGEDKSRIRSVLNVKDLAIIDPGAQMTVEKVCQFWSSSIRFVLEDTPLRPLLHEFSQGDHHLTMVVKAKSNGTGWAYNLMGLCTLEDIIEEIIDMEITDEHDRHAYNRQTDRSRNITAVLRTLYSNEKCSCPDATVQLRLATIQFLSQNLEAFSDNTIPQELVEKMLREYVVKYSNTIDPLYTKGVQSEYFTLLMEGRLTVEVGHENFKFEVEPFQHFGIDILDFEAKLVRTPGSDSEGTHTADAENSDRPFVPDCTVTADEGVILLRLTAEQYRKYLYMGEQMKQSSRN